MAKKRAANSPKHGQVSADYKSEADQILAIWKAAAAKGMGGKRFESEVLKRYEPRLRTNIINKLKGGEQFNAKARANTKKVAADIGRVCAMLTTGKSVSKDTFQDVFFLMKAHPACPSPAKGAGTWCDIPL